MNIDIRAGNNLSNYKAQCFYFTLSRQLNIRKPRSDLDVLVLSSHSPKALDIFLHGSILFT